MRVRPVLRLLLLLALLVTGCGQEPADSLGTDSTPRPVPSGTHGPVPEKQACPQIEKEHLPKDVGTIEAAYVCGSDYRSVPGDGDWSYRVVREVTGGLDALLTAYAVADEPPTRGACTADLPDPLVVHLHASRTVAARAPWDGCGKPTAAARSAYEALTTVVVWEEKESQGRSQLSVDTGCSDDFKDMLWVEEKEGPPGTPPSGAPTPFSSGSSVCRYDVKPDEDGFRIGHLTSGETLTATALGKVNEALAASTPDASCSRSEHTRFALVSDKASWTQVALDGCAILQDSSWWRGTDELRRLLAG